MLHLATGRLVACDPFWGLEIEASAILSPPVTWELALRPGEDPAMPEPGGFFGFGVDSGKGCFLDASAVAAMSRFTVTGSPEDFKLFRELNEGAVSNVVVDRGLGLNAVLFLIVGWETVPNPTWIGRTAAGDPACFIADLELLSDSLGAVGD
jgi:Protein of unknown function (DUF4241)